MGVESDTVKNLSDKMTSLIAVTQALAEIEDTVSSGKLRAIALRVKDMAMNVVEAVQKKALVISTNALTVAEEAKTVATTEGSIATRAAAAVQWLWNSAILANPIVSTVVAIGLMTAAIWKLASAQKEESQEEILAKKRKEEFNKVVDEAVVSGAKEIANLATLNQNTTGYKNAVKELVEKYDGYLDRTEKAIIANGNLTQVTEVLTNAMIQQAVVQGYQEQLAADAQVLVDIQIRKQKGLNAILTDQNFINKTLNLSQEERIKA